MYNWKKILLKPSEAIDRAIEVLDKEALRIVLVVDDSNKLLGTITDGDIRRALIRHVALTDSVKHIMRNNPTTVLNHYKRSEILKLMKKNGLLQIPVIDSNGCVVGLETLEDLISSRKHDNPIFLMAGGFGKRLSPLTDRLPKPLLKIGSKPILENIIEQFIEAGFYKFYISTHYKAAMVRDYFGDGESWGVKIKYIHEDIPLGTAGALGLLPKDIPNLPIIMMNGDLLTKVNIEHLLDFHNQQDGIATVCVREYDFQVPYGVIKSKGTYIKSIEEKPIHKFFVNAGIYVLNHAIFEDIDGKEYIDMPDLLEKNIGFGHKVNMFPIHEYWLDIGQKEEFERANKEQNNKI